MKAKIQPFVWIAGVPFFLFCLTAKTVAIRLFFEVAVFCSIILAITFIWRVVHDKNYIRCLPKFTGIFWCAMLLALLSPVGISLKAAPGLPHFVPFVPGKPGPRAREAAQRGECVLGGCCVVSPGVPAWVLVW